MWAANYDGNAMNVHVVGAANNGGYAQLPGKSLYINTQSTSTLAHELGHNFGLDHTHNGRWPCSGDNETCADCWQEPVSRSMNQPPECGNFNNKKKCEVNGDKLCDTAGEPKLFNLVNSNCQYNYAIGDATDNWGATWTPNIRNIMSYSVHSCRTQFTYGQVGCMLDNLPAFTTTSPGYAITGPIDVCPNQAYTYSVPQFSGLTNYIWQVPQYWTISGQGSRTVSITPTLVYGDNTIYVSPMCGQAPAKLTATVNDLSLDIFGPSEILDDGVARSFTTESNATNYSWSAWPGFSIITQNTYTASIAATPGTQPGYINVSATACGTTIWGSKYVTIGSGGQIPLLASPVIVMYPNPVRSELTLKVNGENFGEELTVEIVDLLTGKSVAKTKFVTEVKIDMGTLPVGLYFVRYINKGEVVINKLIKR
jgi:hypothetical protein